MSRILALSLIAAAVALAGCDATQPKIGSDSAKTAATGSAGGAAAQNVMRWEDYTQTAVDPSDDCTVWYVGDYLKKGETNYSTRIGAFRMPGCKAQR